MTDRATLETQLLDLQIADLNLVLTAIEDFNAAVESHIPTVIKIGGEADNTLMRVGSQMLNFEQEVGRVLANLVARQAGTPVAPGHPAP